MTAEDLLAVQNMAKGTDMSSYEHFKVAEMSSRRPSNAAVWGVVLGGVGGQRKVHVGSVRNGGILP